MRISLSEFGIDEDFFSWRDLAACNNMPLGLFFEKYESDKVVARQVDQGCLSCPVQKECYQAGKQNKETGVWGGFYLNNGTEDPIKNKHKTLEIAKAMAERVLSDEDL